jgi:peptide-methionine (S)-S-oxide reductase
MVHTSQFKDKVDNIAIFGAGCFWAAENAFMYSKGVIDTEVGYCTLGKNRKLIIKRSNKIEVVRITFDPNLTTYKDLLSVFWNIHNPTDKRNIDQSNGERSAIFYLNYNQRRTAEISILELEQSGKFSDPILTELTELTDYKRASQSNQRYYKKLEISS